MASLSVSECFVRDSSGDKINKQFDGDAVTRLYLSPLVCLLYPITFAFTQVRQ